MSEGKDDDTNTIMFCASCGTADSGGGRWRQIEEMHRLIQMPGMHEEESSMLIRSVGWWDRGYVHQKWLKKHRDAISSQKNTSFHWAFASDRTRALL